MRCLKNPSDLIRSQSKTYLWVDILKSNLSWSRSKDLHHYSHAPLLKLIHLGSPSFENNTLVLWLQSRMHLGRGLHSSKSPSRLTLSSVSSWFGLQYCLSIESITRRACCCLEQPSLVSTITQFLYSSGYQSPRLKQLALSFENFL